MNPTPSAPPAADPVALLLLAGWVTAEALAVLLVAAVALLLTLAGWRPAAAPLTPPPRPLPVVLTPVAPAPAAQPLAALKVADLRALARAAGHRHLARNGRRADLLAALA
jgi:hypothetical protein